MAEVQRIEAEWKMRGLLNPVCQYLIAVGKCFQRTRKRIRYPAVGYFKNSHLILLRKFDTCLEISISVC